MVFDVPAGNRRAQRWLAQAPRRAAQGECDFWELPALDRILSLRGLLGRVLRVSWEPMEYVQNAVAASPKNSRNRVT